MDVLLFVKKDGEGRGATKSKIINESNKYCQHHPLREWCLYDALQKIKKKKVPRVLKCPQYKKAK